VSPILTWGLLTGCLVAAADTATLFAARGLPPEGDTAQILVAADQVVNVILFSIAGIKVGRATGIVRSAAEAGVLAGVLAGAVAVAALYLFPEGASGPVGAQEVVGTLALNIAMGGVLALLNGWIATRQPKPTKR
jgi:hypothetical protein